ncbi:MAG: alpha/beta hydrolase fold domain-containing protein [Candidatus Binatia bacterium]
MPPACACCCSTTAWRPSTRFRPPSTTPLPRTASCCRAASIAATSPSPATRPAAVSPPRRCWRCATPDLALPSAAALLSPWLDLTQSGESMESRAAVDPTMVARASLQHMADAYLDGADARAPLASPLFADLRHLPPLLIHVGTARRCSTTRVALRRARPRRRRRRDARGLRRHGARLARVRFHPPRGARRQRPRRRLPAATSRVSGSR